MIHWMQKRKKYLVVTIWISTIAFVGAGFVGWGTYNFNNNTSWVAKVGNTKITQSDFDREYSRLFNIYNQLMGNKLTPKEAQMLGIHTQAIDSLIYTTLMINYAKDLGIYVSDERVANVITQEEQFYELGLFSEKKYREILSANNLRPSDYEEAIRKSLLLKELDSLLNIKPTLLEKESIAAALYMKDNISISIVEESKQPISISEQEIKEYWEKNQQSYMGEKQYEFIMSSFKSEDVPLDDAKVLDYYENFKTNYKAPFNEIKDQVHQDYQNNEAEKMALRRYIEYKKASDNYEGTRITLGQQELENRFGQALAKELYTLKTKEPLKPIKTPSDGFVTIKILMIAEAKPLDFEKAKDQVSIDVLNQKRQELLKIAAQKELENFKGEKIGWISRDDTSKLPMLSIQESAEFLSSLFSNLKPKDYMMSNHKAILYTVHNQQLFNFDDLSDNKEFLEESVGQLKGKIIENAFIKYLQKRYHIVRLDK